MDQFERVAVICNRLRSFASLYSALGGTKRAVFAIEIAASLATECLRDGGILTDDGLVHRPDYCFPGEWTECLCGVIELASAVVGDADVSEGVARRAAALADALDNASMCVPIGDEVVFLPMQGWDCEESPAIEPQRPALTRAQWAYLQALAEADGAKHGADLAQRAGYEDWKRPLRELVRRGYAVKPSDRGGYRIIDPGRKALGMRP